MPPATRKKPATSHRPGPGIVTQAGLARHWKTSSKTVKAICLARGVKDTGLRPRPTYRWVDVWRIEGAVNVAPVLWDAYREPLLTAKDLAAMFPEVSSRTIRRDLATGRWPVIELSDGVRRVRLSDVAEELEIRAGRRPVRRSRASDPEPAASP